MNPPRSKLRPSRNGWVDGKGTERLLSLSKGFSKRLFQEDKTQQIFSRSPSRSGRVAACCGVGSESSYPYPATLSSSAPSKFSALSNISVPSGRGRTNSAPQYSQCSRCTLRLRPQLGQGTRTGHSRRASSSRTPHPPSQNVPNAHAKRPRRLSPNRRLRKKASKAGKRPPRAEKKRIGPRSVSVFPAHAADAQFRR